MPERPREMRVHREETFLQAWCRPSSLRPESPTCRRRLYTSKRDGKVVPVLYDFRWTGQVLPTPRGTFRIRQARMESGVGSPRPLPSGRREKPQRSPGIPISRLKLVEESFFKEPD
jgi:hypothetical protein